MPLTKKGEKILASMNKTYKDSKKAKSVLYASENKGTITGTHPGGKKGQGVKKMFGKRKKKK